MTNVVRPCISLLERLVDLRLGERVEAGRRLVQDEDAAQSRKMARAMLRRCFWPPEKLTPRSSIMVS